MDICEKGTPGGSWSYCSSWAQAKEEIQDGATVDSWGPSTSTRSALLTAALGHLSPGHRPVWHLLFTISTHRAWTAPSPREPVSLSVHESKLGGDFECIDDASGAMLLKSLFSRCMGTTCCLCHSSAPTASVSP